MIGVTNNSPSQINAALIALKSEVKNEVKNEIINNIDNSVIGETYTAGDGISISGGYISQTTDQLTFTGTQAQWEALTSAEKAKYGLVNITDDEEVQNIFVDGSILNMIDQHIVNTTTTTAINTTKTVTIPTSGMYQIMATINNISAGIQSNYIVIRLIRPNTQKYDLLYIAQTSSSAWTMNRDEIIVPLKAGVQLEVTEAFAGAGFRYEWLVRQVS